MADRPQFQISVDMGDVARQAGGIINAYVLPRLNQAVRAVVQATQAEWMAAVQRAPGVWQGEKDIYAQSIQSKMTGDFSGEVWSDYKFAQDIESGRPARDLKQYLNTSQKVRRTKDGRRFLIIPMRHNTPGSEAHAKPMPAQVYEAARLLDPSRIVGQAKRAAGEVTSVHPVWGTQVLKKKKQTPFLFDPTTRAHVMVNRNIYQWGGRLMGLGKEHSRYEGMVRFDRSMGGAKYSEYMTFRVMMEGSKGWIVPAKPGLNLVQTVTTKMQPLAELAFGEAMRRGG